MSRKQKLSIYHADLNLNLMEENVTEITGGITVNVNVSLKVSCMSKSLCSESFCT